MAKAQVLGRPIVFILIGIVSIGILMIGYQQINKLEEQKGGIEIINFITSLKSEIETTKAKPVKSIKESIFSLPSDIEYVCIVDKSKQIDFGVKNELKSQIDIYSDKNMFIAPFSNFNKYNLDNFELNDGENPLCAKNIGGKMRLRFESTGNSSLITIPEIGDIEAECVTLINNGPSDRKIDVAFLGYGYDDVNDYISDVNRYTNDMLFGIEPFKSNKTKMNIWRVDDMSLSCSIGNYIKCNDFQANKLASKCGDGTQGADFILILVDRNRVSDLLSPVRSSARGNIAKINTADNPYVLAHEFGHSFGGLADEYVDVYYENMNFNPDHYVNCGSSCNKWSGMGGGCFSGCSIGSANRGIETSLMKELSVHSYGYINEYYLRGKLDAYS